MNHVVAHVHTKVTTDGAGVGVSTVGCTDEFRATEIASTPSHAMQTTGPEV